MNPTYFEIKGPHGSGRTCMAISLAGQLTKKKNSVLLITGELTKSALTKRLKVQGINPNVFFLCDDYNSLIKLKCKKFKIVITDYVSWDRKEEIYDFVDAEFKNKTHIQVSHNRISSLHISAKNK